MLVFVQRLVWVLLLLCAASSAMAIDSSVSSADVEACHHQELCQLEAIDCIAHCVSMSCCAALIAAATTLTQHVHAPAFNTSLIAEVLPKHAQVFLPPPKHTVAFI